MWCVAVAVEIVSSIWGSEPQGLLLACVQIEEGARLGRAEGSWEIGPQEVVEGRMFGQGNKLFEASGSRPRVSGLSPPLHKAISSRSQSYLCSISGFHPAFTELLP